MTEAVCLRKNWSEYSSCLHRQASLAFFIRLVVVTLHAKLIT